MAKERRITEAYQRAKEEKERANAEEEARKAEARVAVAAELKRRQESGES